MSAGRRGPAFDMRVVPIIRSRSGCFTCRRRKKKCNEHKPVCSGCRRNRLQCRWPPEPAVRSSARPPTRSLGKASFASPPEAACGDGPPIVSPPASLPEPWQDQDPERRQNGRGHPPPPPPPPPLRPRRPRRVEPAPEPARAQSESLSPRGLLPPAKEKAGVDVVIVVGPGYAGLGDALRRVQRASPSSSSSSSSPSSCSPEYVPLLADGTASPQANLGAVEAAVVQCAMSTPMPMLPTHGRHAYELLSYYLARTANSMGNGSTAVNPFVAMLVPPAFSEPLVLQLLLAQSAAHRQASDEPGADDDVAQRYYADSLGMFRNVIDEHVGGRDDNALILTIGSLILCLTEVARGDVRGTIFNHLAASKSLLTTLLSQPRTSIADDMVDFLVEYYMHMTASSLISTDVRQATHVIMSPQIEARGRALMERRYMGQLCGCWLEMLLLIPQIFRLGQRIMGRADAQPCTASSDDIITFGFLQGQILAFFPSPAADAYAQLAALVFKQAVLLYLWSILGTPQQSWAHGAHGELMDSAICEAVAALGLFPASARVNTSLCWPLAVIGCCTMDPAVHEVLRTRLRTMIDTIGLGNMRETLLLLERVWRQPPGQMGPWLLHRTMQDHEVCISFA